MANKLKMYSITIPVPGKEVPFLGAIWAPSPKIALKHCLRKAFRVRGIKSFWIDNKEFDAASTTYSYIVRKDRILDFVKETSFAKE